MSLTDDAVYIEKPKTIFDKVLVLMRELSKVVEYNIKHKWNASVWQPQN